MYGGPLPKQFAPLDSTLQIGKTRRTSVMSNDFHGTQALPEEANTAWNTVVC